MTARRVVLIGAPGAGKSTVGPLLAQVWDTGFRDTDDEVAERAGKSVAEVFVEDGEQRFRELERAVVLDALSGTDDGVLGLGGGAVLDPAVREALARAVEDGAAVVFLDVTLASAGGRVGFNQPRSIALGNPRAQWQVMAEERRPVYQELATHTVSTDRVSPQEVVDRVVAAVKEGTDG